MRGGGKKVISEALERIYGDVPEIAEVAVLENKGALVALVRPERYCSFQRSDVSVLRTPRHRAPPQKRRL